MHGSDPEAQVRAELEQIMPLVSALTGLPARWSGVVELVEGANFKGKKHHTCSIQLASGLASQEARWTTLIHESLHAVSAGYSLTAYQSVPGWEEGVVEQLQRLLRGDILAHMGIAIPSTVLADLDARHRYNVYIRALEAVRSSRGTSETQFYLSLLATPLADRPTKMLMEARRLPAWQRRDALEAVSVSNATLKQSFSGGTFSAEEAL